MTKVLHLAYQKSEETQEFVNVLAQYKGNTAQLLSFDCAVRFFVRLFKNDAGGLSPANEFLDNMTENMQASGRKRR